MVPSDSNIPAVDIIEGLNNITVKINLPGVKKENAKINISEDALELDALFDDEAPEDVSYITRERKQGAVRRIISLPAKINIDNAKANFENGVLIITLLKKEQKKAHKVKVD